jgi:hypothetical protein
MNTRQLTETRPTAPNGSGPDPTPPAPEPVLVPLEAIGLLTQFTGGRGITQARAKGMDHRPLTTMPSR